MEGDIKRYGGMVQLGAEKEVSVVYFSSNWEELGELLEEPLVFIRSRQSYFGRNPGEESQWKILSPVAVELECGWKDLNALIELMGTVPEEAKPLFPPYTDDGDPGYMQSAGIRAGLDIFSQLFQRLGFSNREFVAALPPPGSFFVEFAAYTNNIRVFYFPPHNSEKALEKREQRLRTGDFSVRYQGDIDNAMLVEWETGSSLKSTILHFDLTERTQKMRADFLMTLVEDPYWLCDRLNKISNQGKFHFSTTMMIEEMKPLTLAISGEPTRLEMEFDPGTPLTAALGTKVLPYWEYPHLFATNLSDPKPRPVCQVGKPCPVPKQGKYFLGGGANEAYLRQDFDPEAFVQDVLLRKPSIIQTIVQNEIRRGGKSQEEPEAEEC